MHEKEVLSVEHPVMQSKNLKGVKETGTQYLISYIANLRL